MKTEDWKTLEAMRRYGGGFVHALATAAMHADDNNYAKLKAAFPELWLQYSATAVAAAIVETHPMAEYQKDE